MNKPLLIRKALLIITSIWAILITVMIVLSYFDGFPLTWVDFIWYVCAISMPLFIAHESTKITTLFIETHESNNNQNQPEDELDQDVFYLFDYSKVKNYLNRLIHFK